jgi:hypothetical protein
MEQVGCRGRPLTCFRILHILPSDPLTFLLSTFFPSHDSTILLLYADLFLSKVPCTPLFRLRYVHRTLTLSKFCSLTAIQTETFHLVEGGRFRQRRPSNAGHPGACSIVSKRKDNVRYTIPDQVKVRLGGR